ncbi:MAG TPA: glucose-6-phosphate dehydrogenase assembly protein OpcA [Chloroflexota bacterium]|jgi:glucose-6-phosphate dehydrogenase assembly protein OpcA
MTIQHSAPDAAVWEAQNTTVVDVERQLARILRELSGSRRNGDDPYLVPRASVLNLVVHADEAGEVERASEAMGSLAIRHPSRTLLLVTAPDAAEDGLDAAIHTQRAPVPGGQSSLYVEEVRLRARGSTALHLASVVEPLLMSNLPTYLWWLGRPPRSHEPLLFLADRLIIDSAEFPDALIGLAMLDACSVGEDKRLELGDLGWRRIAPWCQLIAQFFDPHDARPYQQRIRKVSVEYVETESGVVSAAPLLLTGWLAARLGWQPETAAVARGSLDALFASGRKGASDGEQIVAQIRPRPSPTLPEGALLGVTLTASAGAATATFAVRASDDPACGVTRAVLPGVRELERTAPLGKATRAELLALELERPGADPVYAESLVMAGRLVR